MIGTAFKPDYVEPLLRRLASQVCATEAFAFVVSDPVRSAQPQLICHIRPDAAKPELVQAARRAAIQLVEPCLRESKDGAIEIDADGVAREHRQYALVTLLYDQPGSRKIVAAILMIAPCTGPGDARQRLGILQGRLQR